MARRKTVDLTIKEIFINNMIQDSIEHTKGFDVGLISNGEFTFSDLSDFILLQGLTDEFMEFIKLDKEDISNFVDLEKIMVVETSQDDLPFCEEDYFRKENE